MQIDGISTESRVERGTEELLKAMCEIGLDLELIKFF